MVRKDKQQKVKDLEELFKNANTLHGRIFFQISGTKLLNCLKNTELYNNSLNKPMSLKALRKSIINQY